MLVRRVDLDRIVSGDVDLVLRKWKRPTVRSGGTLRTAIGVLDIVSVDRIDESALTDSDARRAGFASRDDVMRAFSDRDGDWYRVAVALAGPDPRVVLRERSDLSADEVDDLERRLSRLDKSSRHGAWTAATLALIEQHPGVRAGDLADTVGRERLEFKADVRKLKALGLTISLEVGYRLSPRGEAFLAHRSHAASG
jgi:hypothetical protein